MLFFRSYFFKGSETDLNKLVQKQLALNSTRVTLESSQANIITDHQSSISYIIVKKYTQLFYYYSITIYTSRE